MSEVKTATIQPRSEQVTVHEAFLGGSTSKINTVHQRDNCYLLVFPESRNSLAVITFDGSPQKTADWSSILDHVGDLQYRVGYQMVLVVTTYNFLVLKKELTEHSEKGVAILRTAADYKSLGLQDGESLAFELPASGNQLSVKVKGKKYIIKI